MKNQLTNDWKVVLTKEFDKPYFSQLEQFLQQEYAMATVYPAKEAVLRALQVTAFQDVKVVLLGQDPYHGAGQAQGLSFSVQPGIPHPPSLRNMLKELQDDIGCSIPQEGSLMKWAQQGVLLLNTVLTVREGKANSHKGQGWELFTDAVIETLAEREEPIVFLLWGKHAQAKRALIERISVHHIILEAPHPSPFSARLGFFGSKPYSHTNEVLIRLGKQPIDWSLGNQ
ncbi:uracil-DNA glycosylase [Solibacillus sp. FSL H8-0538]|uniref:uracil-DNA glycosylase n=1 Tax=Solibacillus sp. FSL H8-0538 TaxID=2921400 RepID=UPI0030F699EE